MDCNTTTIIVFDLFSFHWVLRPILYCRKENSGLMNTSIVSGVISIILNYVCISLFGLIGVGIAAMVSLFVGWLIRIYDTRKFIKFSVNVKTLVSYHIVIFMQIVLIFLLIILN
ncbi:polysaccharide biosynthesis C-terminal domain-containing protein [Enterococcus avium]